MTDDQLLRLLSDADPLPVDRAAALAVDEATADLQHAVVVAAPDAGNRDEVLPPARRRVLRGDPGRGGALRGRRVALVAAAAVAVAVVFAALPDRGGSGPSPAFGAEAVRFAEASPLVLLKADGWRVDYADEQSAEEGELHFRTGPTPPPQTTPQNAAATTTPVPADLSVAQLNWRGGDLRTWKRDRGHDAAVRTTAPVLGTTADVYQYSGGTPGHRDITALFRFDGRILEFRAGAADVTAFRALLATLTRVDTTTWLSAMPASVVKTGDRDGVIAEMLKGLPLPPGFDAEDVKGADLTKDRYQLGAAVSGTVACQWFKRWNDARTRGDDEVVQQAITALRTAKDWPILKEMDKEGAYGEVLRTFVKSLDSGIYYGRPLAGDVNSGLGCDDLGVDLPDFDGHAKP